MDTGSVSIHRFLILLNRAFHRMKSTAVSVTLPPEILKGRRPLPSGRVALDIKQGVFG